MDVGIHFMNFTLSGRPESIRMHPKRPKPPVTRIALDTDVDDFVQSISRYAELGVQHVQLSPQAPEPAAVVERVVARIVPRLAEL